MVETSIFQYLASNTGQTDGSVIGSVSAKAYSLSCRLVIYLLLSSLTEENLCVESAGR